MDSIYEKMKTLARWRKKRSSAVITDTDPVVKVIYLGNVLTGWAKGEGCLEKPLATLWKNYCQNNRSDVIMRLSICSSGIQATTSEHGLTEYWSHRVTWSAAPSSYPRIFAWVYRHEARKLKQELRCHAVLCSTSRQAKQLAARTEQRLREALYDFRREKICRQSARLSVASCLYDDYSDGIPRRKLLLAPGINNYRPPIDRSKSAPKLGSIEEAPDQEEVEERDWLRVLALYKQPRKSTCGTLAAAAPVQSTLETVSEANVSSYADLSVLESPPEVFDQEPVVHVEDFVPIFDSSQQNHIYQKVDLRLRLDSAIDFGENESLSESPCSSTDSSPFLCDKIRLLLVVDPSSEDVDNVSDESGYSEDNKDNSPKCIDENQVPFKSSFPLFVMNQEFTLNL